MPLITGKSDIQAWINPETSIQVIDKLMIPFPESEMNFHAISTDAGNSRKNQNVPDIKNEVSNNENNRLF